MKPDAPRFAVVVEKRRGVLVVFSSGLDRAAADLLTVQLARIGCVARVVPALEGDVPGMQRRRKRAGAAVQKATTCPVGT